MKKAKGNKAKAAKGTKTQLRRPIVPIAKPIVPIAKKPIVPIAKAPVVPIAISGGSPGDPLGRAEAEETASTNLRKPVVPIA